MNKKIVLILFTILLLFFVLLFFLFNSNKTPSFKNISSQDLNQILKNKDFYLINVHTPYEGEIEKTDTYLAYNRIENYLNKLPKDKNAKIVLYCQSGRMSEIAAETLASLGYSNVSNLVGGMVDWEKQGFNLIFKN